MKKRLRFLECMCFISLLASISLHSQTVSVIDQKGTIKEVDGSTTNEIQDLTLNTTTNILTITLNGSPTAIDLSPYLDNQTIDTYELNADGQNLDISLEDDGVAPLQVNLSALVISGDVTGTLATSVVEKIQTQNVSSVAPTDGQALLFNTTSNQYEPTSITLSSVSETYPNAAQTVPEASTFTTINFGSQDFAPNTLDYSNQNGGITVLRDGRYKITYRITSEVINNTRVGGEFRLTINNIAVNNTSTFTYQRNNLVDKNTVTMVKILDLSANDEIGVEGRVYDSSRGIPDALTINASGSMLTVERLKLN